MMPVIKISLFRPLVALLLSAFFLNSCVYFNTYYNARRYFKEGVKENKDDTGPPKTSNYQKAIDSAARVVEYYPKSKYVDDALMIMGKSYYGIQNYVKAKRKFDELITNYPNSPLLEEAQLWQGKTLIALGQAEAGVQTLTQIWSSPAKAEIRLESQQRLADYHFGKKNYRQALSEYEKILQNSQNSSQRADIWFWVGESYLALEEYTSADSAYLQVLKEKPNRKREFEAIFKRSVSLRQQGQLETALGLCDNLMKKEIYYSYIEQVYLAKAEILVQLQKHEEAEELLKRILELYPRTDTSAKASFLLGEIYLEEWRSFEKAEEYLLRVQTEKPQSEFAQPAQVKVNNLRLLKKLNRQLDSLQMDLDTLNLRLSWLAEHPGETFPEAKPDTVKMSTLPDSLQQGGRSTPFDSLGRPESRSRRRLDRQPEYTPGQLPGMENQTPGQPGQPPGYGRGIEEPLAVERPIHLAALPSDSLSVQNRMTDDQEELALVRYRLAEHLWRQFDDADSARTILTDLSAQVQYQDVAARSMLLLYDLFGQSAPDSTGPDSLLQQIHLQFSGTTYDRWVRQKLGLEPLPEPVDSAQESFLRAEDLWMTQNLPQEAVVQYFQTLADYPQTEWAAKALYAAAWLEEHVTNDLAKAKANYDTLLNRFPNSPFVEVARRKLEPPPPEVPDTTGIPSDTTLAAIETIPETAPPGSGLPQLLGGEEMLEDYIHKNHLYPPVALEANLSGNVLVAFTVNTQGEARDFNILSEAPEGFDFGAMAIQALQAMHFRPGYEAGQYQEKIMTQSVRFNP